MTQNYYLRYIVACFTFLCCFSATVLAQGTSPAPQGLPFSQDFSTLAHSATTYPVGFQGWKTATGTLPSGTTTYVTTGVLLADQPLVASSNASNS